jgi:hypothetical protein
MKHRPTIWQSRQAQITLARQLARRQVLRDIRDHGLKLRQFSPADIALLVTVQLVARPEHLAKAKAICAELHQRELRKRLRRLAAKQCSLSNQTTNTALSPASMASKEIANER